MGMIGDIAGGTKKTAEKGADVTVNTGDKGVNATKKGFGKAKDGVKGDRK